MQKYYSGQPQEKHRRVGPLMRSLSSVLEGIGQGTGQAVTAVQWSCARAEASRYKDGSEE